MALTLALDSAFIVLSLRGKSFTLTAPEASVAIGEREPTPAPNVERVRRQHIHWKYHERYDQAFDLGTLGDATEVIRELGDMLPSTGAASATANTLIAKWDEMKAGLARLPVLANAAANVEATILGTSVKITDIGLELDLTTKIPAGADVGTTRGGGAFTLGLAFTPAPAKPIRLFALGVSAFGAVLSVKLDGLIVRIPTPGQSGQLEFE